MKKVIEDYLSKANKMGLQLKSERMRQLNNCQKQFDKKITLITNQQKDMKDKYKIKFKEYLDKHQAVMHLSRQYDEQDKDFSGIKKVFLEDYPREEEIKKQELENPIQVEDIKLEDELTEQEE
mmetsp:Transcript_21792/g.24229  ORF Transcript_21792/g.24229 Transcript_21792/m.24229 type:complete len:123 (-) Transcript_21792:58-426(-)|eukprot:CAMPEP_0205832582 /NCGR_PEP_ID=MMETSP0206-20130828/47304_1 /ASSEMBLY_ACC=CAM_ASM_000279 /TAXON_ID=36767 /ORGANISM="Euplotes focardii, Strain TN1" /LENGTH=122 /DNA_ID=CAMNT_0053138243 /DNA_START=201 /DNA_END=572 /DNA_ORIENTATION=-